MTNRNNPVSGRIGQSRNLIVAGAVGISFVVGTLFGGGVVGRLTEAQTPSSAETQLFQPFWQAWSLMHSNYVEPLDDNKLMQAALAGMMNEPGDQFTNYFDPATYKATSDQLAGQITGIGANVKKDDKTGALQIVSLLAGSPALEAGLKPGDLIFTVDGADVTKLAEGDIIDKVRGTVGSTVTLGIRHTDSTDLVSIKVTRRTIVVPDVTSVLYNGNIGYIALTEFGSNAGGDLRAALAKMNADHLHGLILDLRGNPGGYVTTAIDVASQFLASGNVFTEKTRSGALSQNPVNGHPLAPDVPLVVLVDGGSASASEIVTGALQDAGRATVIGTRSYGKGSEQIIQALSNGGAAHITIARWFTPKGRTIQTTGLTPDIIVPYTPDPVGKTPDLQLQEALLVLRGQF